MSGPIVRKYGFPNFDKIFGERELQHGVDENEEHDQATAETPSPAPKASKAKAEKPAAKPKKKKS